MTLVKKIANASMAVGGALIADKRNHDQQYDYLSADKVLAIGGQALANAELAVFPSITKVTITPVTYTSKYGDKTRYDALVNIAMKVADGEESICLEWIGAGSDYLTPDKAVFKAITSGHKYFLMKLLNIGAGNEDGEHEYHDEPPWQQTQQRRSTPKTTKNFSADAEFDAIPGDLSGEDLPFKMTVNGAVDWAMALQEKEGVTAFGHRNHAENALKKLMRETNLKGKELAEEWVKQVNARISRALAEELAIQADPSEVSGDAS